jgi:fructose-1,6-bisphosphatase I
MEQRPWTLSEHVSTASQARTELASLPRLIDTLAVAAKVICNEVGQAGLGKLIGLAGKRNVQGEDVFKLDEFCNDTLIRMLTRSGLVCAIGSEELAVPIRLPGSHTRADYAVAFDPLDGSSNIDVAVSIGTIFSIFRRRSDLAGLGGLEDLLQPARDLVAAGYVLYGSSTVLVYGCGQGVHGFTLDPSIGEFLLSHPDVRLPARGSIVSVNTGNRPLWRENDRAAIDRFERPDPPGKPYSMRYVGSLVADAHRTLLKGGLFSYPADSKNPRGKLRLLYEAGPLAFLFEAAGGIASDGERAISSLVPETLHDRTPLVIGSKDDVQDYLTVRERNAKEREQA